MLALRILLSVSFIFAIAFAYTQNTDVKLNVFTPNNNFESNLLEKLQTTKNFFKNKYVSAAFMTTAVALSFVPVPGIAIINPIRLLLEEESDWKPSFAAAVTDKIDHGDLLTTIKDIESKIGNIDEHIRILNNSKIADDLRRTSAELVHHDYNEIIHKFKNSKTLFKKYALITSPVLVALATSFAQFYPTALSMIPEIVNDLKIPCKVLDLLFEYRPIAVDDRFDKIGWTLGYKKRVHAVSQLENVRVKPYDENGYDDSNALSCDKGCVDDETVFKKNMMCLKDQYGFDEYLALNYSDPECLEGYAALVRERVEQMFPVKFYNELCERNSIPTGFGWLTFKIEKVQVPLEVDGSRCDDSFVGECDTYFKIKVNGAEIMNTRGTANTQSEFEANIMWESKRIPKNSSIEVQVWDKDERIFSGNDDLLLETNGDIDSYLKNPIRKGAEFKDYNNYANFIETAAFWIDELKP